MHCKNQTKRIKSNQPFLPHTHIQMTQCHFNECDGAKGFTPATLQCRKKYRFRVFFLPNERIRFASLPNWNIPSIQTYRSGRFWDFSRSLKPPKCVTLFFCFLVCSSLIVMRVRVVVFVIFHSLLRFPLILYFLVPLCSASHIHATTSKWKVRGHFVLPDGEGSLIAIRITHRNPFHA